MAVELSEDDDHRLGLAAARAWAPAPRIALTALAEAEWLAADAPVWGTQRGWTEATAGLRLGYALTRRLRPYLELERSHLLGGTRRAADTAGETADQWSAFAGLRVEL